jgi:hypothetical protein
VVWKDQKLYYIFEVKTSSKKEKFATELPQDAENWIKAIEEIMPKPSKSSLSISQQKEESKISLSASEWTKRGNQLLNLIHGEEVCAILPETTFEIPYLRRKLERVDCFITNYRIYVVKKDSEFYGISSAQRYIITLIPNLSNFTRFNYTTRNSQVYRVFKVCHPYSLSHEIGIDTSSC